MGFLDNAFNNAAASVDKGLSTAKGAINSAAVVQQPFMKEFCNLCRKGAQMGWHEGNGGNLSYRLTNGEVVDCRSYFDNKAEWQPLGVEAPGVARRYLAITGSGTYMANVPNAVEEMVGIVEIGASGNSWRLVWGLKGGKPSSELVSHILNHSALAEREEDDLRILYHAHPANLVAMTTVLPADSREVTRRLWKAMTETIIMLPTGAGVTGVLTPGSMDLAFQSYQAMREHNAVIWAKHGAFTTGTGFDSAFGLMETMDKAAGIYLAARAAMGGSDDFPTDISDDELRKIARDYSIRINEKYLD